MRTRWPVPVPAMAMVVATVMSAACALLLVASGCGGGGDSPTPTTPTPPVTPPVPSPPIPQTAFSLSGRVVSTATGQAIAGARVAPEVGTAVTSTADGSFQFSSETNPAFTPYQVTVTADGYVTRTAYLRWERTRSSVEIDLLPAGPPFSMDFYRQLVRNGHEQPGELEPLRRWTTSPSVYIRTLDQDGRTIDPQTLDMVQSTVRRSVQTFSGGTLSVAGLEMGTATRELAAGWINVELIDQPDSNFCGQALLGANPGRITLSYNLCGCGSLRVRPSTVAHEVGHAMGFWHVRDAQHIMASGRQKPCPEDEPTIDERFHARLAYRRAIGNRDPDQDVSSGALARPFMAAPARPVFCFPPDPD